MAPVDVPLIDVDSITEDGTSLPWKFEEKKGERSEI
jgi:hypothetical protein